MAQVILEKITKKFGDVIAVNAIDLVIADGEFMVLVGPSGCGKTTLLRMVAGLEELTSGTITIGDRVVNHVPPKDRDIAMVFQNYALYPHMNVFDNMAFALKIRKYPKEEIIKRVTDAAHILGIEALLKRKPKQLSGGQRQRVALGRAMVRKPAVFLFDEPLSNLDAKLRVQMRTELAKLQFQLKTTSLYVTHDQVEAMTMGSKIAIIKDGLLHQTGTPLDIYERPVNFFVAGFIGSPPMNFFPGQLKQVDGHLQIVADGLQLPLPDSYKAKLVEVKGEEFTFGIRPEHLHDAELYTILKKETAIISGMVDAVEPMGAESYVHATFGANKVVARVSPYTRATFGAAVQLVLETDKIHIFDKNTLLNLILEDKK